MSDFNHTVSVQLQRDDGTAIQMSNTFTIGGVVNMQQGRFSQVFEATDPIPDGPPPIGLPGFFMVIQKVYDNLINTMDIVFANELNVNLKPGWVFISPDGTGAIRDTDSAAVTGAGQIGLLGFTNSNSAASQTEVISLNTIAS